jgi:hypothetical protein
MLTGFGVNASHAAVRFGSSRCQITASTATNLTCITGPLGPNMTASRPYPLSVIPALVRAATLVRGTRARALVQAEVHM